MPTRARKRKVGIESQSRGENNSNITEIKPNELKQQKEKTNGLSVFKISISLIILSSIMIAVFPEIRWNILLFWYMPTMSGLYLNLEFLEQYRISYLNWELNTFPNLFLHEEIPEILANEYTWEKFQEISNNFKKTVVIRGLFNNSVAIKEFGTNEWVDKHRNFEMMIVEDTKNASFKYEYGLKSQNFGEFMDEAKNGGKFKYGYGLDEIYRKYPELVNDLEIKRFGKHNGRDYNFCQSFALFIGQSGSGLRWHNANNANLAMLLQGKKTFQMIDPKYSFFMGPEGNKDPAATGFAAKSPKSIVEKLPISKIDIYPGDVLYQPPWNWHAVDTIADKNTGLSLLNTCRFGAITAALTKSPPLEFFRHMGFINWLHPKMPLLFRFVPFARVVQDSIRELTNNMPYWDSDDCYSAKRSCCEKYLAENGWALETKNH